MKKQFKTIICLVALTISLLCLAGCASTGSKDYIKDTNGRLRPTAMQDLYYDTNTKIVYILFNECTGYMSPYYAPNGMPYTYDASTNTLKEIERN
jgi:hypothetical protein